MTEPQAGLDPLHTAAATNAAWTTVNISEAFPGVPTPLSWTFFSPALDYCFPAAFSDLGLLARSERGPSASLDGRWSAIFHGRPALNVDLFRAMGDRSPGSSGDAVEEQMFGSVQTVGRSTDRGRDRWPVMAIKGPRTVRALPGKVRATAVESRVWWQDSTSGEPCDAGHARALFAEAVRRIREAFRTQLVTAMIAQNIFAQVQRAAVVAGAPGLRDRLLTGYGSLTETALLADLWQVSRGERRLAEFLAVHGYHGPAEGELSSRSWREDAAEVHRTLAGFREQPDADNPTARVRGRARLREEAERTLLAATPALRRTPTKAVLRLARGYIPLREDTKSAFLRVVDVARSAARYIGEQSHSADRCDSADDVFYLTVDELLGDAAARPWHVTEKRRAWRAEHTTVQLPDVWVGNPNPVRDSAATEEEAITGIPVSPGVVEGSARVIIDPHERDGLEPGEILVCRTTDPSWTTLLFTAAGVAIDIGGPMSHGAIVARELGVPCVINTRTGTRTIRTGDRVRLDGSAGTVQILRSARAEGR